MFQMKITLSEVQSPFFSFFKVYFSLSFLQWQIATGWGEVKPRRGFSGFASWSKQCDPQCDPLTFLPSFPSSGYCRTMLQACRVTLRKVRSKISQALKDNMGREGTPCPCSMVVWTTAEWCTGSGLAALIAHQRMVNYQKCNFHRLMHVL